MPEEKEMLNDGQGYERRHPAAIRWAIALAAVCASLAAGTSTREQPASGAACGWKPDTVPSTVSELTSLAGTSPSDVWAVGIRSNGQMPQTAALHFNGTSWSFVHTNFANAYQSLNGVSALTTTEAWAVGSGNERLQQLKPLALHWDGAKWSVMPDHIPGGAQGKSLSGVTEISNTDVWAVGTLCDNGVCQPLAEIFDGASFVSHNGPERGKYAEYLSASGDAPTNVWAVGFAASPSPTGYVDRAIADRWNGARWVASNLYQIGLLISVKVNSASDVWAVGQKVVAGNGHALVEHWNGSKWTVVPNPAQSSISFLTSVSGTGPNDVWVAGIRTPTPSTYNPITEHWDGSRWTETDPIEPSIASRIAILDLGQQNVFLAGTVYGGGAYLERYVCH